MLPKKKLLVVTDLDATLLDPKYSWAAAEPAIERLRALGLPLVLNSSKTLAEMAAIRAALRLETPIVAENGGLIAFPKSGSAGYQIEIKGLSRAVILRAAHELRRTDAYRFGGFADWSPVELADLTGLSLEQAAASLDRQATEPILWHDTEARRLAFAGALAAQGVRMLRGGQFWHLMGMADKADGVAALRAYYQAKEPGVEWQVLALGDSANDTAMLEAADIAVVIPHTDGPRIAPQAPRVIQASSPASAGWNAALLSLLNEYYG
ncbi:MAG: HAD-IIB family hydrolase [Puniceicoccaceae bacterium]|nr:MAG: HAD-IIB family hydrolase [Puniceicoccaceae bacterium]